ncbi:hypothetical protein ACEWY4_016005 [Coilia grayii]|uniref:Galactosyltransferase N-terminal domain-containing protein n=1 Tax=Coilia grayii TaxID=363190 RepID=A0ABD1JQG3_9TELE
MPEANANFGVLHRTCKALVFLCFIYISVTLVYYAKSVNFRLDFMQNQQSQVRTEPNKLASKDVGALATRDTQAVNSTKTETTKTLEKCPDPSPLLVGPLRVEFSSPVSLDVVMQENPELREGGRYTPADCVALQKVALIIPFRNREEHLKYWLYYLHPILRRQQLDYGVYVINQAGEETFNRAKLLNVGYVEALKEYDYDCFVFSDVDLIPMDDRNTYRCFSQPRHLSVSMDKFGFSVAAWLACVAAWLAWRE